MKVLSLLLVLAAACLGEAQAMTFEIIKASNGVAYVQASGDIVPGDADRLTHALHMIRSDAFGLRELALDSNGGDVKEALRMVAAMDRFGVYTFVSSGQLCASACASVLYVSGRAHVIVGDGMLLFHPCTESDGFVSLLCNVAMVNNAVDHGVPADKIAYAVGGPDEVWINADFADCVGFTRDARGPGVTTCDPAKLARAYRWSAGVAAYMAKH